MTESQNPTARDRERDRGSQRMMLLLEKKFHFSCWVCDAPLEVEVDDDGWLAGTKTIPPTSQISILHCTKCNRTTCAGCGKEPKINKDSYWTSFGVINHCCDGGKAFGVSFLLAQTEKYYLEAEEAAVTRSPSKLRHTESKSKSKSKSKAPKDLVISGVGYAPEGHVFPGPLAHHALEFDDLSTSEELHIPEDYLQQYEAMIITRRSTQIPEQPKTEPMDAALVKTMKLLIPFLPCGAHAQEAIEKSILLDRISDLARNDSIADIVERQELYQATYDLVRHIATSGLGSLVVKDRNGSPSWFTCSKNTYEQAKVFLKLVSKSDDVPDQMKDLKIAPLRWIKSGKPGQMTDNLKHMVSHATAQAMHTILGKPAPGPMGDIKASSSKAPLASSPAKAAKLTPMEHRANTHSDKINAQSALICKTFIDLYELLAQLPENPKQAVDRSNNEWTKFWEDNKLTFSDDVLANHRLHNPSLNISSTPARNRLNTINREIANLCTSLPFGVFLKVGESHTDVMKALIVGVEGTPYAGGLFTFDIMLPGNYPNAPPRMNFVLEKVDEDGSPMNPNLHTGGQVCLSLLNTWDGSPDEMWQPGKSTILSVLVSVQAMILGAAIPWLNEPGMSLHAHAPECKEYTLAVECKTVKYGMIQWLQKLQTMSGTKDIWHDVNEAYWKYNSNNVLATVGQWATANKRIQDYSPEMNINPLAYIAKKKGFPKGKKKAAPGEDLLNTLAQMISPESAAFLWSTNSTIKHASEELLPDSKRVKTERSDSPSSNAATYASSSKPFGFPDHVYAPLPTFPGLSGVGKKKADAGKQWVYTGQHKLAEVRAACDALNVKPANSIQKSIDRLEQEVNNLECNTAEALRWGEIR